MPPVPDAFNHQQNSIATVSNLESKEEPLTSGAKELKKCHQLHPWIQLEDEVFSYPWPDSMPWESLFFKLSLLKQKLCYKPIHIILIADIPIKENTQLEKARDDIKTMALHYAALSGNPLAVKELIDLGYDKDAEDGKGATALHGAALSGNPLAVEGLIHLGYDKDATNNDGATALHYAASSGNPLAVEGLIHLGYDKDAKDNNGATALHYAAYSGNPLAVEKLINLGCNKNAKTNNGATALHYAALSGNPLAVEKLINLGYDKDAKDNNGATALHYAAYSGNPLVITLLIKQYGLKPDAKTSDGSSILDWAKEQKKEDAIDFCKKTDHLNELYQDYFASHIAAKIPDIALPKDIANIVVQYAAPTTVKEKEALHRSINKKYQHTSFFLLKVACAAATVGIIAGLATIIAAALLLTDQALIGCIATAAVVGSLSSLSLFKSHKMLNQSSQFQPVSTQLNPN